jgi:hypothetical protein
MKKHLKLGGIIALGITLLILLMGALACGPEEAVPRSYSCNVYTEQGCAKFVVASGGEIEIQSGGTFDLQSGATVDFSGGVDLDGSTLAFDTDGDTTMVASTDDIITATVNVTDGYLVISVGNLKVGNGSPSTAQDGEDAYVEGGFEVDGTARFDGAIDANSTADIAGNISSSSGPITITDNVLIDGAADAIQLQVQGYTTQTNNLAVFEQSGGTDVATLTNAGILTVLSSINGTADVDVGTWANLSLQSTIVITEGSTITPTGTYQVITSSIACTTSTSAAIADGGETGDVLILRNGNAADAIVVDGTGANVECKANVSLGASDTLMLIWNGSDWNCVSNYDNS